MNKIKRKQYCREYHQKHRVEILQRKQRYYQSHLEERKTYRKQYYKSLSGYLRFVWLNILKRCNNPKHKQYKDYGGRGIQVKFICFDDFYDYVINILGIEPRGLTIDRIDNNGDYEKGNIRFITQAENNRNKRKK